MCLINKGAIGALDGTLVHAVMPINEQTACRGQGGGRCYQNVFGICDFDMIFTFVWARWEGIAHDSRVLTEVVHNPTSGFPVPPPSMYCSSSKYVSFHDYLYIFHST